MKAGAQRRPAASRGDRRSLGIESIPRDQHQGLSLRRRQATNGIGEVFVDVALLGLKVSIVERGGVDETVAQGLPAPSAAIAIRYMPPSGCEEPRHNILGYGVELSPCR